MKEMDLNKGHFGSRFTKAQRKTYFDVISQKQLKHPGPGDYGGKRMFDNK